MTHIKKERKQGNKTPDRTRKWHVYFRWENRTPTVIVCAEPGKVFPYNEHMVIRTISAHAAGRKYIRDNLVIRMAEIESETPRGHLRPERIKKEKKYARRAVIRIERY